MTFFALYTTIYDLSCVDLWPPTCRDECRHFNISDFMEMGAILCQSVLEFQNTQENKAYVQHHSHNFYF